MTAAVADHHLTALDTEGFAIVEGFLGDDELSAARDELYRSYPTAAAYAAAPGSYESVSGAPFAGLLDFPFAGTVLSLLALDERLLDAAERVIGTDDIALIQARTWAKYSGAHEYEQLLHQDFGNHSLVVPRHDGGFGELQAFVYLEDVTDDNGPTYVVAYEHTRHLPVGTVVTREDHPDVYANEMPAIAPAGALLLYRPDTYHRGSTFRGEGLGRFILGVAFAAGEHRFTGQMSWPAVAAKPEMGAVLAAASVRQRAAIGLPPPGHPYWTPATIDGVADRYRQLDMSPYREASGLSPPSRPR